jgi:tetratricopeptide (TPR) repeat protein
MHAVSLRLAPRCAVALALLSGFAAPALAQTAATAAAPSVTRQSQATALSPATALPQTATLSKTTTASQTTAAKNVQRAESIVVFPFENSSHDAQRDWLGEGLAELLNERLIGHGPTVFTREERLVALEKLGLPAYSTFSRATMLKIAAEIDADYVIFGEFAAQGQGVYVTARVLGVNPPRLSPVFAESGPMDKLTGIDARISSRALCEIKHSLDSSQVCDVAAGVTQASTQVSESVPAEALEYFVRGVLISDDDARLRDLQEAVRLGPGWDAPLFALGQTYYARRDCESAAGWFARVPANSTHAAEANFDSGVCQLLSNDPLRAETAFSALTGSPAGDSPEILNNRGAARLRQVRYKEAMADFARAQQLDPGEPDYWFNLGLAQYLQTDWEHAIESLREVVRLQPDSSDARLLLAAALDHTGSGDEANTLRAAAGDGGAAAPQPGDKQRDFEKMSPTALAKLARIRMDLSAGALP